MNASAREPEGVRLASAPDWLLDLLVKPPPVSQLTHPVQVVGQVSSYGRAALAGEAAAVASAVEGTRNCTLNKAAFKAGQLVPAGLLDGPTIVVTLAEAAAQCGLDEGEAVRTLASGLTAGMANPRTSLMPDNGTAAARKANEANEGPGSSLSSPSSQPWPILDQAARYGLAGDIVATIEPHSEADPVALLLTLLVTVGAMVGSAPHMMADGSMHPPRFYAVLVGRTSRGRKGTAFANVRRVLEAADPDFDAGRILSGLASGEGLIAALSGDDVDKVMSGDRRRLVYEPEFARVLKVCNREGATLSAVIRDAWDRGDLHVLTRHDPLSVTGAHVCMVGHITVEELQRTLTQTEAASGFANRFLFGCVQRSKRLPSGGNLDEATIANLGQQLRDAVASARKVTSMSRSAAAERRWAEIYNAIDDEADGLFGAITARAEAQMLRLSVVYALLDGSATIDVAHLEAAHAVWRYCEDSAAFIFGNAVGEQVADRLLRAVQAAGADGYTRTQAVNLFSGHIPKACLDRAIELLIERGRIVTEERETGGKPATVLLAR